MIELRNYQNESINRIRKSYQNGYKRPLLVLPTGAGKTLVFSFVTMSAVAKNNKVLILVHRDSLFKQTSKTLSSFQVRHGLIGSGYSMNYGNGVQVAKVGTMVNRLNKYTPDLIIVDEAHHCTASQYRKIIEYYPAAKVLGVTATPIRTDGVGLIEMFDDLIVGCTINELIELDYLVSPRIFEPPIGVDLTGVHSVGGDYNKSELEQVMNKPTITGDAVSHYKKLCGGVPAVVFCVSVKHSEDTAEMFRAAGYRAESVSGKMPQADIDRILNGLGSALIDVVTSCDIISEGTDIPRIGAIIMLRPTQSEALYLQQAGRGLRPCEGKSECIILDHVGNTRRHGHPCEDRPWTLEGKKKKRKGQNEQENDINIKVCESCFYVFKPAPVCPCCGWVVPAKERTIEAVDGELVEVEYRKREKKKETGRARTLAELQKIEAERGYKKGWAWNMFNARSKK
jgi:superfamily II DNA or RNA helicase